MAVVSGICHMAEHNDVALFVEYNFKSNVFILFLLYSTCTGFFSLCGAGGTGGRKLCKFHFCAGAGSSTGLATAGCIAVAAGGIASLLESLSLPESEPLSSPSLDEDGGTGDIGPTGSGRRGDSSTLTSGDDSLQSVQLTIYTNGS